MQWQSCHQPDRYTDEEGKSAKSSMAWCRESADICDVMAEADCQLDPVESDLGRESQWRIIWMKLDNRQVRNGMGWKSHPECGWGHFMGRSLKWTSLEKVGWAESKEQGCIHVFALDRECAVVSCHKLLHCGSLAVMDRNRKLWVKIKHSSWELLLSGHFIPEAERKQGQTTSSDQQWLCRLRPWLGWP